MIKQDHKRVAEASPSETKKHLKHNQSILKHYPQIDAVLDDAQSLSKAIETELLKVKPRDTVLIPLMKSTYAERRSYILEFAISVQDILKRYPALGCSTIVSCCYI